MAKTGSDSNPGTSDEPWLTIQKALDTLTAGQTALVGAGTYTQSLVMDRSGTAAEPITVKAAPGEQPVIHASGTTSNDYPVRITAGAAYFRLQGFVIENAPLDGTVNVWVSDGQKDQPQAAHDIEILGNEIRDGKGTGMLVSPRTERVHVVGNSVHGNGFGTEHQHQGIYVQGQNAVIAENIVYDQPNGFGIQVRGEDARRAANNVLVTQNTSVNNSLAGIVIESTASNVTVVNNISSFNGTYGIHGYYCCGTSLPDNIAHDNVLFGNADGPTYNTSGRSVVAFSDNLLGNPLFVDRENGDFHLQAGSAALNVALPGFSLRYDRQGVTRPKQAGPESGAYERQG